VSFLGEFPPFCKHKKGPSTSTKGFLIKKKIKKQKFKNYLISQWVPSFVTKI